MLGHSYGVFKDTCNNIKLFVWALYSACKCDGTTSHLVFKSYLNEISFSRKYPRIKQRQVKYNTLEIKYKLIINYKLDLVPAQCLSAIRSLITYSLSCVNLESCKGLCWPPSCDSSDVTRQTRVNIARRPQIHCLHDILVCSFSWMDSKQSEARLQSRKFICTSLLQSQANQPTVPQAWKLQILFFWTGCPPVIMEMVKKCDLLH